MNKPQSIKSDEVLADLEIIDSYADTNPDTALFLSSGLLEKSEKKEDLFGIIKANFWIGYLLEKKEKYGASVTYYLEAIRQLEKTNHNSHVSDKVSLRKNLASIFRKHEANELATRYNLEGIQIAEKHGVFKKVVSFKLNQGLVYQKDEQYDKAIEFFQEVLRLSNSIGYESNSYRYKMLNQIGLVHFDKKAYDSAMYYFSMLLNIEDSAYLLHKGKALHNIGEVYYEKGNFFKTISLLREAIDILNATENLDKYSLFLSYSNLGMYLFETNQIEEAIAMLTRAESMISYADWDYNRFNLYKSLSDIYFHIGNEELGNAYLKIYNNEVEAYHGVKKENLELIANRFYEQVEKEEKEGRMALMIFYVKFIGGSFLGVIVLIVAYNRVRSTRIQKREEALKRDKMVSDLKALKAQINPHFLFNSLNSIQSYVLEGEESLADDYLVKYGRLMRMILNHSNELTIYMNKEIEAIKLYVELEQLRLTKTLNFEVNVGNEMDMESTKIPSMVIQPLVENAIWHGIQPKEREGELLLEITERDNWICVVVADNGVGFDTGKNGESKPHGLKMVQERINILNEVNGVESTFHIASSPKGTRIEFSYPEGLE